MHTCLPAYMITFISGLSLTYCEEDHSLSPHSEEGLQLDHSISQDALSPLNF